MPEPKEPTAHAHLAHDKTFDQVIRLVSDRGMLCLIEDDPCPAHAPYLGRVGILLKDNEHDGDTCNVELFGGSGEPGIAQDVVQILKQHIRLLDHNEACRAMIAHQLECEQRAAATCKSGELAPATVHAIDYKPFPEKLGFYVAAMDDYFTRPWLTTPDVPAIIRAGQTISVAEFNDLFASWERGLESDLGNEGVECMHLINEECPHARRHMLATRRYMQPRDQLCQASIADLHKKIQQARDEKSRTTNLERESRELLLSLASDMVTQEIEERYVDQEHSTEAEHDPVDDGEQLSDEIHGATLAEISKLQSMTNDQLVELIEQRGGHSAIAAWRNARAKIEEARASTLAELAGMTLAESGLDTAGILV